MKLMGQAGASGNITNEEGRTALHEAGTRGYIDLLEVKNATVRGRAWYKLWTRRY